ncbi:ATP-binding protein [Phormidium sp. FACHB-592]|uniref:ATP-binding protein n=1 Tax=Stenomitos frigidus AS-A4 TaxID=2933935 RepID=A0ABV0KKG0_9CYAN|nr:ATP-binding protein [Phormidium sp. FACHB-592]MBD2077005.1 ATP-binding protein [Phormidium sp. FACHB-592]
MEVSNYKDVIKIPNGSWAVVAKYCDHKQPEYNLNPLSRALPLKLSIQDFIKNVKTLPIFDEREKEWGNYDRFDCIERLSRYFDPESKTIELYYKIWTVIASGYLGRNPIRPEYAQRAIQLYTALSSKGGKYIENFVKAPLSAPSITLFAPSGVGKTANRTSILELFPQIIAHPELGGDYYQIVWLCIDSPITSLKGFCSDIFMGFDRLLGSNYFDRHVSRNKSVDDMLAQVAILAHKHHLGVLVVEEMQAFFKLKNDRDEAIKFLTKLDNTLGVPLIRIGTDEMSGLFKDTFVSARRATGTAVIMWDRIINAKEWEFFFEGMWQYQWTRTFTPCSDELMSLFYEITQGIHDIAIKLYKMVQWRAISLGGDEVISIDLIRQAASESLVLVEPMLKYIREHPDKDDWKLKYSNIQLETAEYRIRCLEKLEIAELEALRLQNQMWAKKVSYSSPKVRQVIVALVQDLGVAPSVAKQSAEKAVAADEGSADLASLVSKAYIIALQTEQAVEEASSIEEAKKKVKEKKLNPTYAEDDLRLIADNAKKNNVKVYDALIESGSILDNPLKILY